MWYILWGQAIVRQFIGYRRFETDEELRALVALYPVIMRYHNFEPYPIYRTPR
jgi:hypothetical protein